MRRLHFILMIFIGIVTFSATAQVDSTFILKENAYFSNEDFGYLDSSLHGRLCWYSNGLADLDEPVLYNLATEATIYRFSYCGAWGISYAIRLEKSNSTYTLFLAKYNETIQKKLDQSQAKKFEKRLKKTRFWEMPTRIDRRGFDGSQWIFEGIDNSEYHVVDRWSPKKRSRYRKMCEYLISLSL